MVSYCMWKYETLFIFNEQEMHYKIHTRQYNRLKRIYINDFFCDINMVLDMTG